MRISVSLPASETLHTLVVGIELDPATVDLEQLHGELCRLTDNALARWRDDRTDRATDRLVSRLVAAAAFRTGLDATDVRTARRGPAVEARQVVMHAAVDHFGMSLSETGRRFGMDHTTVLHAVRKVRADPKLAAWARDIVHAVELVDGHETDDLDEEQTRTCEGCGRPGLGGGKWCLSCFQEQAHGDRRRAS